MDIKVLHKQGKGIRQISNELGISRNTVRKYLRSNNLPVYSMRASKLTKLNPYHDYIQSRIKATIAKLIKINSI